MGKRREPEKNNKGRQATEREMTGKRKREYKRMDGGRETKTDY